MLEPVLNPLFHRNSYGYRPGCSALDAIAMVRRRSWEYDWVIEFDIKGLFDNIKHDLLMRALKKHCQISWVLLYIERWLKAPMQTVEDTLLQRTRGTPQGGVVSPLLANLFLHYAFDVSITRQLPGVRFCRYADDAVVHCKSLAQAHYTLQKIGERFRQCGLELHPEKTRIVYCKDINRQGDFPHVQFTFLGYTFRPRKAVDKYGRIYVNFVPAVSRDALRAMRQTIRGWQSYYGRFHGSAMSAIWKHMNDYLTRWLRRKYKHLARHKIRARRILGKLARSFKHAFVHWELGCIPTTG